MACEMTVATQLDDRLRPVLMKVFRQAPHDFRDAGRLVPPAWPEQGKDHLAGHSVKHQQGHVAVLIVIGVEQAKLLCTVSVGVGVIGIDDDLLGSLVK